MTFVRNLIKHILARVTYCLKAHFIYYKSMLLLSILQEIIPYFVYRGAIKILRKYQFHYPITLKPYNLST